MPRHCLRASALPSSSRPICSGSAPQQPAPSAITTSQPCRVSTRMVAALISPSSACCAQPASRSTRSRRAPCCRKDLRRHEFRPGLALARAAPDWRAASATSLRTAAPASQAASPLQSGADRAGSSPASAAASARRAAAIVLFDIGARDVDQVRVIDLDRAGGDAGQARQAAVEVMDGLSVRAPRPFPAWRGSGRCGRAGNRSRRGTAHRSGTSRCRSRNARRCAGCRRPRAISGRASCCCCERGLQRLAAPVIGLDPVDWTWQSQHIRPRKSWFSAQSALGRQRKLGAARKKAS